MSALPIEKGLGQGSSGMHDNGDQTRRPEPARKACLTLTIVVRGGDLGRDDQDHMPLWRYG